MGKKKKKKPWRKRHRSALTSDAEQKPTGDCRSRQAYCRAPAPHARASQRSAVTARPRLLPSAAAGGARGRARAVPGMQRAGGSHQDGGAAGRVWERSGLRPHPAPRGEAGPAGRGGGARARGVAGATLSAAGRRGGRAERGAGIAPPPPAPGLGVRGGAGWGGPGGGGRGCCCACGGERVAPRTLRGTGPGRGSEARPPPARCERAASPRQRRPAQPARPRRPEGNAPGAEQTLPPAPWHCPRPACSHPADGAWVYLGASRIPCPACWPGGGRSADR